MVIRILGRKFKTFSHYFFLFIILTVFSGCVSSHYEKIALNTNMPDWVLHPSKNGVVGGVGYCAAHVNGINGQRELASKRAIEEIARQKGVYVDSIMVVSSKASNNSKYKDTKTNTVTSYQTKKQVTAYIKEIWVHPVTKVMYVYMVAE